MTVAEDRLILMDLLEHFTQKEFVYTNQWRVGELVIWDNTATLYRAQYFDLSERLEFRRATTSDALQTATV
ncbi:MAG: hypothetical protein EBQ84_01765 [Betaproteobacteria bacterium]|jgi:alpha-ketoglutarate-dependent 2,4-dichlorophenoxyacetate dioxygenase|nr:hypothetical protein [Betaproteobacteria bacterium]